MEPSITTSLGALHITNPSSSNITSRLSQRQTECLDTRRNNSSPLTHLNSDTILLLLETASETSIQSLIALALTSRATYSVYNANRTYLLTSGSILPRYLGDIPLRYPLAVLDLILQTYQDVWIVSATEGGINCKGEPCKWIPDALPGPISEERLEATLKKYLEPRWKLVLDILCLQRAILIHEKIQAVWINEVWPEAYRQRYSRMELRDIYWWTFMAFTAPTLTEVQPCANSVSLQKTLGDYLQIDTATKDYNPWFVALDDKCDWFIRVASTPFVSEYMNLIIHLQNVSEGEFNLFHDVIETIVNSVPPILVLHAIFAKTEWTERVIKGKCEKIDDERYRQLASEWGEDHDFSHDYEPKSMSVMKKEELRSVFDLGREVEEFEAAHVTDVNF